MVRSEIVDTITNLKGEEGHKWVLDTYNSIKPLPRGYTLQSSDPWCAATVSAVFHSHGYDDIAEVSCLEMVRDAQKLGIWVENDNFIPQPGDIILYDWQDDGKGDNKGTPDHVGIVIQVDKRKILVREGNKRNSIGNRDVTVDGITIRGYIIPPYEEAVSEVKEEPQDENPAVSPAESTEAKEKQEKGIGEYVPGHVYTVTARALNVRRGAGVDKSLVGYAGLTADGKKHAYSTGALRAGTKVTCLEVKTIGSDVWIRIPSGWVCAEYRGTSYIK